MASFRDSSITKSASAHTIAPTIPALAVAGDLLVMFVQKSQDDPFNYHDDWQPIDLDEYSIGTRLSSTCMWKIVTAADISAGSWSINCSPSVSVGKVDVIVVAYDISDWSGLVWDAHADGYKEGTSASSFVINAIPRTFEDGITIISLSHRLASRTGAGSSTHGSLRVEADVADTDGLQVYDTTADILVDTKAATVSGLGTADTYHVIGLAFGPSAVAGDFPPCGDTPDGGRVDF